MIVRGFTSLFTLHQIWKLLSLKRKVSKSLILKHDRPWVVSRLQILVQALARMEINCASLRIVISNISWLLFLLQTLEIILKIRLREIVKDGALVICSYVLERPLTWNIIPALCLILSEDIWYRVWTTEYTLLIRETTRTDIHNE